jgi:hypothetical protein
LHFLDAPLTYGVAAAREIRVDGDGRIDPG